jgi:FtsP/CotA-like multicopper oxidase with cupredoxin domain
MRTTFPSNPEPDTTILGLGFLQIETEGGCLPQAVFLKGKGKKVLLLAPAERADLLVDFSNVATVEIIGFRAYTNLGNRVQPNAFIKRRKVSWLLNGQVSSYFSLRLS